MRSILSTLIVSLSASVATAQFHIGVKVGGGVNYVNWKSDNIATEKYGSLTSIHVGVFSKLKLAEKFSVTPELQYIMKGNSVEGDKPNGIESYKVKINYLELPVLVNYQIIKWLGVEAGPSLGIKIGAKAVSSSSSSNLINDYLETVDFGVLGGVRFSLADKWSIITRYNYGLTAVLKSDVVIGPDANNRETVKSYNRSIQLSVAYQIR